MVACAGAGVGGLGGRCDAGTVAKGLRLMTTARKVGAEAGLPAALDQYVAMDMVARIDGTYTEFFNNDTKAFELSASASKTLQARLAKYHHIR